MIRTEGYSFLEINYRYTSTCATEKVSNSFLANNITAKPTYSEVKCLGLTLSDFN